MNKEYLDYDGLQHYHTNVAVMIDAVDTKLESAKSDLQSSLDGKSDTGHTHTKSQITDFPSSMPASDVYSWAKSSSKPSYSISEISGLQSALDGKISWNGKVIILETEIINSTNYQSPDIINLPNIKLGELTLFQVHVEASNKPVYYNIQVPKQGWLYYVFNNTYTLDSKKQTTGRFVASGNGIFTNSETLGLLNVEFSFNLGILRLN